MANVGKMRQGLGRADAEKIARWQRARIVFQESTVGWSTEGRIRTGFPWPVTEDALDGCLANIELMREDVRRIKGGAKRG